MINPRLRPLYMATALFLAACGTSSTAPTGDADTGDNGTDTTDNSGDNGSTGSGGSTDAGTDTGGTDNGGTDNGGTDNGGTDNGGTDNGGTDNGGTDNGGTDTAGCPEAATFMDLTGYAGAAGAGYDDPELTVTCTDTTILVASNGIPQYNFVQITPNDLASQNYNFQIPRNPALAGATSEIPLLGPIGVAVNGIPLYGPNEAAQPDPYGDPVYNQILDYCMGHTAAQGTYHYHALFVQCLSDMSVDAQPDTNVPSPIIGWSFDGFPLYGPIGCLDADCNEVVEFKSGWNQIGDPTTYAWDNHEFVAREDPTYLDECNGRIGPDGTYRYHATETFPYILGCYSGNATANGGGGGGQGGGGDTGGGNQGGPPLCEETSDCEGLCPNAALGCTCHETPMGDMRCVPMCNSAADCPGNLSCDTFEGVCVPG